ncbi:hypothetical protein Pcinc_002538 [Petrolisthes cinctipes]|uniref:Uncharacterized protein n=1 Tax=Petrolisthes cinctipes TaxID=88211 RepID=A0AAE1GJ08_PETCI|nr:hypothetical protein Pcinc_002538 [Petrolisthes cinctipes]
MQLMMPQVTEDQLKNKLKNLKQVFRAYREAVSKTGNPQVKEPPHFDLLYSLYEERPLDRPQTVSCSLQPEGEGAATPEGQLSAEEDVGEPIQLPQQPTAAGPKVKRRRVRPPSHSERMERMHYDLMQILKEYQEKSMNNQGEMI